MKIGLHVRLGEGPTAAVQYAQSLGCSAIQVFIGNPRSYKITPIDEAMLADFAALRKTAKIDQCVIHTSYLINLASDDPRIRHGSANLLTHDLRAAAVGKMRYVNTHIGSYGERDRQEGFATVCRALERALETIETDVDLVLENSAGAGNLAGGTLDELGAFLRALDHPQLGICIDTAHAWASGYALDTPEHVDEFLCEADAKIGLARIKMLHINDTQIPLGGARDRHWHIGRGNIGLAGFRALLTRPELARKTAILETPGERDDDAANMEAIRAILE